MLIPVILVVFLLLLLGIDGGIKGFRKVMRSQFPKCLVPMKATLPATQFDHVCIDMNQILHSAIRRLGKSNSEKKMYSYMYYVLDEVFRMAQPAKSVVFAFDGPAPFAKLNLQRNRRTKDSVSNQLSPGTDFMAGMEEVVLAYLLQRLRRPQFANLTYYISDAETPGEGEIKIIQWVNQYLSSKVNCNDSIALYGADSDMVVQAMCINVTSQVYIIQSEPPVTNLCNVSSIINTIVTSRPVSDVDAVRAEVLNHVLLLLLRGNDYLPSLGGISRINTVQSYRTALPPSLPLEARQLFKDGVSRFNYPALYQLMQSFGQDRHAASNNVFLGPYSITDVLTKLLYFNRQAFIWDDAVNVSSEVANGAALPCPPERLVVVPLSRQGLSVQQIPAQEIAHIFPYASNSYKSKKEGRKVTVASAMAAVFPKYWQRYQQLLAVAQDGAWGELEAVRGVYKQVLEDFEVDQGDKDDGADLDEYDEDTDNEGDWEDDTDESEELSSEVNRLDRAEPMPPQYSPPASPSSSVPHYLKGLLWVMHMYIHGRCKDHSYSYSASNRVSASEVCKYLEDLVVQVRKEKGIGQGGGVAEGLHDPDVTRILDEQICPTFNSHRPLSPSSTCICVFPVYPRGVGRYVPTPLRGLWAWVNKHYFRRGTGVGSVRYDELVYGMESYIESHPIMLRKDGDLPAAQSNSRDKVTDSATNRRRPHQHQQEPLTITSPDRQKWTVLCPSHVPIGSSNSRASDASGETDMELSKTDPPLRGEMKFRHKRKYVSLPLKKLHAVFSHGARTWPAGYSLYESTDD